MKSSPPQQDAVAEAWTTGFLALGQALYHVDVYIICHQKVKHSIHHSKWPIIIILHVTCMLLMLLTFHSIYVLYEWRCLVKRLGLYLWELWRSIINTLITECHNSHKHSPSLLTRYCHVWPYDSKYYLWAENNQQLLAFILAFS